MMPQCERLSCEAPAEFLGPNENPAYCVKHTRELMAGLKSWESGWQSRRAMMEIMMCLGEASALFMSQDIKCTEIVMPSAELEVIGRDLHNKLKELGIL